MFKRTISLLLVLLLLGTAALAHTAQVPDTGAGQYKALVLTPELYAAASPDLSDLRLWDAQGEAVPYFIHSADRIEAVSTQRYPMLQTDAFQKDGASYVDYAVDPVPDGRDVVATSAVFSTGDTAFAKEVEIWGGYDGVSWTRVGEDVLYDVEGNKKLETIFSAPQKYTHYRFGLSNNLENISLNAVTLCYSAAAQETRQFLRQLRPAFTVAEAPGETVVSISGVKHLRLTGVTVETDSMFQRTATVLGAEKRLYRLTFDNATYVDTTVSLDGALSREEMLTLTIQNHDDAPIHITGIRVEYAADELVFEGRPGDGYILEFDGGSGRAAPVYDIATYAGQILQEPMDRLEITRVTMEAPAQPEAAPDYTWAFRLAVVAAAAVLGVVILLRLRKSPEE